MLPNASAVESASGAVGPRKVAVQTADGSLVASRVTVADHFLPRLLGLMGRSSIDPEEGLWLVPCNSVHMFFMRTPLDIAYLDRQLRVVRSVPEMREWRVKVLPVRHAHSALELAPGTLRRHGISDGDELRIEAESVTAVEAAPQLAAMGSAAISPSFRE